jgi:hypothetical protein
MAPIGLKQVIDCMGATIRNDNLQPTSDPPLTLSLRAAPCGLALSESGSQRTMFRFMGTRSLLPFCYPTA